MELPDIKEQEKIGKALKNIDEKIRNNNLICSNLTKVTSLLYEYWFVQFDFPDEKGEPYRASGGKMKFDSSLNQNIPEFWEEKTISEIASRVKVGFVGTVDKYYCEREDGGVPIIRPAEMGEDGIDYSSLRFVTKDFHNTNLKSQLHPGDILISRCGKEGIPNIYDENHEAQVLNAVIIEPNDENGGSVFVNEVLKSQYSQIQISNGTSGSVQGVINTEMIGKIKLAYDKDIVKQFEQVLIPLYKEISRLRKENRKLKELVEWIAPMMLSGHVKI